MKWNRRGYSKMSKTVSNYFKSIIKRQKKLLFLYTIIGFVAFPMVSLISNNYDLGQGVFEYSILINMIFMVIGVMLIPLAMYYFSLNKKSTDTYYALPISRKDLFNVHFFAGLAYIYIPLLINYLLGTLILTIRYGLHRFALFAFFIFLCEIVITTAIYSINTLIVNKANNLIDAILLIVGYTALPYILIMSAMSFDSMFVVGYSEHLIEFWKWFDFVSPLTVLIRLSNASYALERIYTTDFNFNFLWIIYEAVIATGFYILGLSVFKKRKGEDSEQVTKDFFTYPLLLNLISIALVFVVTLGVTVDIIYTITIFIISFIIYLILQFTARRSVKITSDLLIKYFVLLISFNLFTFICNETYYFGINLIKPNLNDYSVMYIRYYDYDDKKGEDHYALIDLNNMDESKTVLAENLLTFQEKAAELKKDNFYSWNNSYNYNGMAHITVKLKKNITDQTFEYISYTLPKSGIQSFLDNKNFGPDKADDRFY